MGIGSGTAGLELDRLLKASVMSTMAAVVISRSHSECGRVERGWMRCEWSWMGVGEMEELRGTGGAEEVAGRELKKEGRKQDWGRRRQRGEGG